jgi:hypothetical protein
MMNTDYLAEFNPKEEQKTQIFLEHMYKCSGREDPSHPMHSLYTGLYQEFCIREAGPLARERWFEMQEAIRLYEEKKLQPVILD